MTNNEIQNILEDLYKIDDNFKKYEKELIKIINELLVSRPDTKFDQNFRMELRTKLIHKAEELSQSKSAKLTFNFMNTKKLYYFAGALAVIVLLIVPAVYLMNQPKGAQINFGLQIARLDDAAFGALSSQNTKEQSMALGIGAGGGGGMAPTAITEGVDIARMPAPYYTNYNFTYIGDELETVEDKIAVLKRLKETGGTNLNQFLNKINFDALNLSKFSDSNLKNLSFAQDKDFGYFININLEDGSININENYNTWPHPERDCRDEQCYEKYRLNISQVPDNETLISIANKFISEYGLDVSMYGQPEINQNWKEAYETASSQKNIYIPESISVIYPLMINNKYVYDQGGNKQGLNININLKYKKISGVYNFTSQNYQSSDYDAETDTSKIIELAKNGGLIKIYQYPEATKTVEVKLDTPTISYVKIWNYNSDNSEEIIVPAYIFPVINYGDDSGFWQKNIIVPLAKDFLEQDDIRPIPEIREAAAPVPEDE